MCLAPSFPWLRTPALHRGTIQGKEGIKFCHLATLKGRTLEDMSGLVGQLTMKIGERKARLAPIIKELRPLRQKCQNMEVCTRTWQFPQSYYGGYAVIFLSKWQCSELKKVTMEISQFLKLWEVDAFYMWYHHTRKWPDLHTMILLRHSQSPTSHRHSPLYEMWSGLNDVCMTFSASLIPHLYIFNIRSALGKMMFLRLS